MARGTKITSGGISTPSASRLRLPAWSPSTTRRWTCSSMEYARIVRSPSSDEPTGRLVDQPLESRAQEAGCSGFSGRNHEHRSPDGLCDVVGQLRS